MDFFNSAIWVLQALVIPFRAEIGIWGIDNLPEDYDNNNLGANAHVT